MSSYVYSLYACVIEGYGQTAVYVHDNTFPVALDDGDYEYSAIEWIQFTTNLPVVTATGGT